MPKEQRTFSKEFKKVYFRKGAAMFFYETDPMPEEDPDPHPRVAQ